MSAQVPGAGLYDQLEGTVCAVALDGGQREVLGQALADALEYRTFGSCKDCDVRPEGLCNDHAADLDLTDAYIALASYLGIEVPR